MGVRETLNKNPSITTGATAGIVILALGAIVWQVVGAGSGSGKPPTKSYFTDDDGATWYADDINLVPPYSHNGKTAVRCFVYKTANVKPYIAYMEKYTDDAKKKLEAARAKTGNAPLNPMLAGQIMSNGMLVKKPMTGEKNWIKENGPGADKVTDTHPPDNSSLDTLEPVTP